MTNPTIEYAGFYYEIVEDEHGFARDAFPIRGQHKAASKDKHRRAACEEYDTKRIVI